MSFWRRLRLASQLALLVLAAYAAGDCGAGSEASAPATERWQSTFNL